MLVFKFWLLSTILGDIDMVFCSVSSYDTSFAATQCKSSLSVKIAWQDLMITLINLLCNPLHS